MEGSEKIRKSGELHHELDYVRLTLECFFDNVKCIWCVICLDSV